jgi:hypothetical protein
MRTGQTKARFSEIPLPFWRGIALLPASPLSPFLVDPENEPGAANVDHLFLLRALRRGDAPPAQHQRVAQRKPCCVQSFAMFRIVARRQTLFQRRECVLFIGTQFSNLYTAVDTPAEAEAA